MNQCENCGEYREDLERIVLFDPWTNERDVYEHVCATCADQLKHENDEAWKHLYDRDERGN